jgi:hypothetical protein
MKNVSQKMESRIFTITICADMMFPSHYQQLFSINIWASICGDNLFVLHVLPDRPTGWNYEAFLETDVPNFLASVVLIVCRELHFVHDGTHISVSLPTDT